MERREAQRPASLAARIPKAAPPVTGNSPWMRLVGRKVCPAGLVSLLLKGGDPPWRLPALHPQGGEGKRERRAPNVSKQPAGGALARARLPAAREVRTLLLGETNGRI